MDEVMGQEINRAEIVLASRWARFWAATLDGILLIAFMVPVIFYTEFGGRVLSSGDIYFKETVLVTIYVWLSYLLCHGYLLHKKGQTIGKNVFEIAIVDLDGKPIGLPMLLLKRTLPMTVLGYIPIVGSGIQTVNILFIFRKDRRCIHDLIAGTQVVSVEETRELDFSTFD